jgi:diaminopimelate decarboxylase
VGIFKINSSLSVNYLNDDNSPTFKEYYEILFKNCKELFSGKYYLMNEFGRSIISKTAFVCSKIEYTKFSDEKKILIIHVGKNFIN